METNIQKYTSENIFDILREFIYKVDSGCDKIYIGEVVNNRDPKKKGRCRIKVFGVCDNIPDNDLPWAVPELENTSKDKFKVNIPEEGSRVSVRFENGDIYKPVYSNKVITNYLSNEAKENYPNTVIMYEDKNGNVLKINKITNEFSFKHSSGSEITIDMLGNITIDSAMSINTKHELFMQDSGKAVIPSGTGPYCAIPVCPYSSMAHVGQIVTP